MRFLIDAHLPKSVATAFSDLGHEVIHTREMPKGNATPDNDKITYLLKCLIISENVKIF